MLTGVVVYGQFHELFQHLTLARGTNRLFHILPALGVGQEPRKLIENR